MKELKSNISLGPVTQNIAIMLRENSKQFSGHVVYREKKEDVFHDITWQELFYNINKIAGNLKKSGFNKGDKLLIYSPNRLEMLELEFAVMAIGGISVPVFAFFIKETVELLIRHSDAKYIAVAGALQLGRLSENLPVEKIFVFDDISDKRFNNLYPFSVLKEAEDKEYHLDESLLPDEICLNMYTSGTMGVPKCVQLTHRNILSQQAAIKQLWKLGPDDRFLSYLPWHHSFGGIFEKFSALCSGATMTLEPSYGKSPESILSNWKEVQPSIFFSVPKVYQALFDLISNDPEAEKTFFHPGLRFVFTAAAALPQKLSDEFEKRGVAVVEGWGLTETSPCCALTDPALKRETGVVGMPIPGVSIRIADDEEIHVKGPNVMVSYYKNDEANKNIFTEDGWYRTGDVGAITPTGLKLISRKDRIFKLTNGEKVVPTDLEKIIEMKCHHIAYAIVTGAGQDYPVALLFPNLKMLERPDYFVSPMEGCFCPRSLEELCKCLRGCLNDANCGIKQKFSKIKAAVIINDELSVENGTLTPSMKAAPKNIVHTYKAQLEILYTGEDPLKEDVYVIKLDTAFTNV
jgi:long-subunit acyl-CoA synthetase (AMP-forming)